MTLGDLRELTHGYPDNMIIEVAAGDLARRYEVNKYDKKPDWNAIDEADIRFVLYTPARHVQDVRQKLLGEDNQ